MVDWNWCNSTWRRWRACADALIGVGKPFDLVIANAGVMAGPKRTTPDGFEAQFGTNHIGHFVLINRIAGLLRPGGRVVMVASAGHRRADVDLDDPNFERHPYEAYTAYGRSKTATILFAVEFDRRHRSTGTRATAVHPGAIMTETVQEMVAGLGDAVRRQGKPIHAGWVPGSFRILGAAVLRQPAAIIT